jgi:serine/threonine protein kinase
VPRENLRRFQFIKEIASGGFGSVFVAKVSEADGFARLMAVKLLHQRWSDNVEVSRRMKDEARLLGALRHRNIVNVFGFTTIGGRVAVMMEYLEAVDLKVVIAHHVERRQRMPVRAALEIVAAVASALDAAWSQPPFPGDRPLRVIHRDIKPSNIMVDDSGVVKVLDFGVARAEFDHRESHTQELQFGSVDYMPPERLFFEPETDRSDIYSLGATLFELLSGRPLGKAKGREERHVEMVEERLGTLGGSEDMVAVVHLLRAMCSYNAEGRPPAAEVMQRCRASARASMTEGLSEWSERTIPHLVTLTRDQMRDPNPLTESVLIEDATSLGDDEPAAADAIVPDDDTVVDAPVPPKAPAAPPPKPTVEAPAVRAPEREEPAAPPRGFSPAMTFVAEDLEEDDATSVAPRVERGASVAAVAPVPSEDADVERPGAAPASAAPVAQAAAERSVHATVASVNDFDEDMPTRVDAAPPPVVHVPADVSRTAPGAQAMGLPIRVGAPSGTPDAGSPVQTVAMPRLQTSQTIVPDDLPVSAPLMAAPAPVVVTPGPVGAAARPPSAPAATAEGEEGPVPRRRGPVLFVGAALFSVVVGGMVVFALRGSEPAAAPAAPVGGATPDAASSAAAAPPDAIRFLAPGGARKISVKCGGAAGEGVAEAFVAGPGPVACDVTVQLADRTRVRARVDDATAGAYRCFDGDARSCVR